MTLPADYFDELYSGADDPWGFAHRWYEARKRALTLAALPRAHYGTAFEPGCSVGVLTAALAPRCEELLATDVSERALRVAGQRLRGVAGVRLARAAVPRDWPDRRFDLVVLSELLYYLDDGDLRTTCARAVESVALGGTLLAVHWLHPVADYPQTGTAVQAAVTEAAAASGRLHLLARHEEPDFALTVHVRGNPSVAAHEGLS